MGDGGKGSEMKEWKMEWIWKGERGGGNREGGRK